MVCRITGSKRATAIGAAAAIHCGIARKLGVCIKNARTSGGNTTLLIILVPVLFRLKTGEPASTVLYRKQADSLLAVERALSAARFAFPQVLVIPRCTM
jgi:hypothetical protein